MLSHKKAIGMSSTRPAAFRSAAAGAQQRFAIAAQRRAPQQRQQRGAHVAAAFNMNKGPDISERVLGAVSRRARGGASSGAGACRGRPPAQQARGVPISALRGRRRSSQRAAPRTSRALHVAAGQQPGRSPHLTVFTGSDPPIPSPAAGRRTTSATHPHPTQPTRPSPHSCHTSSRCWIRSPTAGERRGRPWTPPASQLPCPSQAPLLGRSAARGAWAVAPGRPLPRLAARSLASPASQRPPFPQARLSQTHPSPHPKPHPPTPTASSSCSTPLPRAPYHPPSHPPSLHPAQNPPPQQVHLPAVPLCRARAGAAGAPQRPLPPSALRALPHLPGRLQVRPGRRFDPVYVYCSCNCHHMLCSPRRTDKRPPCERAALVLPAPAQAARHTRTCAPICPLVPAAALSTTATWGASRGTTQCRWGPARGGVGVPVAATGALRAPARGALPPPTRRRGRTNHTPPHPPPYRPPGRAA